MPDRTPIQAAHVINQHPAQPPALIDDVNDPD